MRIFGKTDTTAKPLIVHLVCLACLFGQTCGQDQLLPDQNPSTQDPSTQDQHSQDRNEATTAIRDSLDEVRRSSFDAKLRVHGNIFGQEVIGTGKYVQLRGRPETLFRLELTIQAGRQEPGRQEHSVLHVCDGRYLWMRRQSPSGTQLSRVDMRRLREAARRDSASGGNDNQGDDNAGARFETPRELSGSQSAFPALTIGGIPRLMDGLSECCEFLSVRDSQLGRLEVWEVIGQYKAKTASLGPHVPDKVIVTLGRQPPIPLFPYRIEYLRTVPKKPGSKAAATTEYAVGGETLLQLDFFEVGRRTDLLASQFTFHPGDLELVDRTDEFLKERKAQQAQQPDGN